MATRYNVLFITADQWRGECFSALGHPTVRTPHLDELAADGTLFRNHFSQCAPCGPSRTSIFTGMYLMNHRSVRNGVPLDARFTNLALEARKAGYEPVLFGYTDTSTDPRAHHPRDPVLTSYSGVMPGFREVLGSDEGMRAWRHDLSRKGYDVPGRAEDIFLPKGRHAGAARRGPTWAPARYRPEDSDTAFMVDRALDYIHTRDGVQPWFVHLSLHSPHPPFVAPAPYHDLYHPDDVPDYRRAAGAQEEARQHPYAAYMARHHLERDDHDPARHPATEPAMRQLRATYYGMMSEVDHHLGRMVEALRREDRYDDTLIVFGSDHGEQLWDHWLLGKETYYDQGYHVPLIVRAPGRRMDRGRGRVVDAPTENVSIMATVLELLDCEVPVQCDGRSLTPFLTGRTPRGWPRHVCWELDFRDVLYAAPETELGLRLDECNLAVLRDHRYKYVHFTALPPLLFDLERDPDELHDLAGDPEHAPVVLELAQRMLSWRLGFADRTLTGIRIGDGGAYEVAPGRRRWARPGVSRSGARAARGTKRGARRRAAP